MAKKQGKVTKHKKPESVLIPHEILCESVMEESDWEEQGIKFLEVSEWMVGHDSEYRYFYFEFAGKTYRLHEVRAGSPWTDWNYELPDEEGDDVRCYEVVKQPVTRYEWVAVYK